MWRISGRTRAVWTSLHCCSTVLAAGEKIDASLPSILLFVCTLSVIGVRDAWSMIERFSSFHYFYTKHLNPTLICPKVTLIQIFPRSVPHISAELVSKNILEDISTYKPYPCRNRQISNVIRIWPWSVQLCGP